MTDQSIQNDPDERVPGRPLHGGSNHHEIPSQDLGIPCQPIRPSRYQALRRKAERPPQSEPCHCAKCNYNSQDYSDHSKNLLLRKCRSSQQPKHCPFRRIEKIWKTHQNGKDNQLECGCRQSKLSAKAVSPADDQSKYYKSRAKQKECNGNEDGRVCFQSNHFFTFQRQKDAITFSLQIPSGSARVKRMGKPSNRRMMRRIMAEMRSFPSNYQRHIIPYEK